MEIKFDDETSFKDIKVVLEALEKEGKLMRLKYTGTFTDEGLAVEK